MRPTVIRLIVGGALGIAFSVSLWLPGTVVFPEDAPIRHLAAPDVPSTMIVRAAAVPAPKKAPAPQRLVVQPVYPPVVRTAPVTSVVRRAPSRSGPAAKPVTRTAPPAQQQLTPLSKKVKKARRQSWEKEERPDETRERERDRGDEDGDEDDGDEDDGDEDNDDEGGDDRGGDGNDG
jgi:hypothetical protein